MAIELQTLENKAFFSQNISLLNTSFQVTLKYNSTDKLWRFSLKTPENVVVKGVPLVANTNLTGKYKFDVLRGGNFWCLRKKVTTEPVKFDNLGFDKDYGLFFLTTTEEKEIGL